MEELKLKVKRIPVKKEKKSQLPLLTKIPSLKVCKYNVLQVAT